MRYLKYGAITIIMIVLWTGFVTLGRTYGFLLQSIESSENSRAFIEAVEKKVKKENVGNIAIALVKKGRIEEEFYYSKGDPVDKKTLFQMASVSKWITAWGIFKLVEQNNLSIDEPVSSYLKRWKLPESDFDNEKVTIKNLLSHTAGLTDGLGYDGFEPNQSIQSIEQSLKKAADAEPYASGVTEVGIKPNTQFRYSGGGYTILQLIIEEVSGVSFQKYMTKHIFEPLKMQNSTFELTSESNLAQSFKLDGTLDKNYRYTALAAASLYTCVEDLTLFLEASGSSNPVLSITTQDVMNQEIIPMNDHLTHGLGPFIYGNNQQGDYIIGHDGNNRSAINTSVRVNNHTNEGIIILESGNPNLATRLGDDWVFWKTGILNFTILNSNRKNIWSWLIIGNVLIVAISIFLFSKRK